MPHHSGTVHGKTLNERLGMTTVELKIPARTVNALEKHYKILYVHQLLKCTPAELLAIPNFGQKSLSEVYTALGRWGFWRNVEP